MPFYTAEQPEKESTATWVSAVYNIGNVFPLVYMLLTKRFRDFHVILTLLGLSSVVCVMLAFFSQVAVGGVSLVLYILTLLSGLVGCTGIVALFAYLSQFPASMTSSLSGGLAGSGIVVTVLALIQDAGHSPRFSPLAFYWMVFVISLLPIGALFAIEALHNAALRLVINPPDFDQAPRALSFVERLAVEMRTDTAPTGAPQPLDLAQVPAAEGQAASEEAAGLLADDSATPKPAETDPVDKSMSRKQLARRVLSPLLNITCSSCVCYMLMPGLLPYALKPFAGYEACYQATNVAFQVCNMLGRLAVGWYAWKHATVLNMVQGGSYIFCFITAACGLAHAFLPASMGWFIAILFSVQAFLNGYIATIVYVIARELLAVGWPTDQKAAARWLSLGNQGGCLVGTYLLLILVKAGCFPSS